MNYEATCEQCGETTVFKLTKEEHRLLIDKLYYNKKILIQDIFPTRTPAERELLRGGMCGKCFKEMFG